MHKLIEYICDELDDLERKAEKEGKLSMAEVEYGDMLAHFKKNILTAEAMMGEGEYSNNSYAYAYEDGGRSSYARGRGSNARRDSRGRYSRNSYEGNSRNSYGGGSYRYSREDAKDELMEGLRDLQMDAKDEQTRQMVNNWMRQLEQQ